MKYTEHKIEWTDEKISRLWDYYSRTKVYSNLYFSKLYGHQIIKQSHLPIEENLEVLDFGSGPGFIWDHIIQLKSGWHYTAIDFSQSSINRLKQKAAGHNQFRTASHLQSLPSNLPSCHFDVILLLEVVEHLNNDYLDATLAEATRLLKKGGVLVITTPNNEDLSTSTKICPDCGAIFHEWQHVRSWTPTSLSKEVEQYGLKLRFAKTLDFRALDFNLEGIYRRFVNLAKRLINKAMNYPHTISVFQKK